MLAVVFVLIFLAGALVGRFLNRCVERLPYEKSVVWPGTRCRRCLAAQPWYGKIPLLGYWIVRRRCTTCGERIPPGCWLLEVGTGAALCGVFQIDVVMNVLRIPFLDRVRGDILQGVIPWQAWVVFGWHALLVCFLLTISLCDLKHMEIPLSMTITGAVIGLVGSTLLAWPFPGPLEPRPPTDLPLLPRPPQHGLYPWPVWHDPPAWLAPGTWQMGLATGVAGALVGMLILRGVRFLFGLGRGLEGLGIGDADLMMMAGAFVGWQIVLTAFFLAVFPALVLGIGQLILRGDQALPFGPPLAGGVLLALWTWPQVGDYLFPILSQGEILVILAVLGAVFLLGAAFVLRLVRGTEAMTR
jgi:leader peptidase (prepilin peptidase)/N-methyltransferase